jgi:hypothetical protein
MTNAFGLTGACLSVLLTAIVSCAATHRISQRYFEVRYEYRRLGWLAALTAAFYVTPWPMELLPQGVAAVAKVLLLGAFVLTIQGSPVFERGELTRGSAGLRKGRTA